MARWLFKEEPDHYSFADLERDCETLWVGVANALAQQHLRRVRPGDEIFFYHTGKEKAVVGVMRVAAAPEPDPEADKPTQVAVRVEAGRRLPQPGALGRVKAGEAL